MTDYIYGMRLRPFGPLCQPMDGLVDRLEDNPSSRYWDVLRYNRKLTEAEEDHYDLVFMGTYDEEFGFQWYAD